MLNSLIKLNADMNAHYDEFKTAFLKRASDDGYDPSFLEGFLKSAEDRYNCWETLINKVAAQSGDPAFREKLAGELLLGYNCSLPLEKQAMDWGDLGQQITGLFDSFGSNLGQSLGIDNAGGGLGGGAIGGGGGLILGLLLHQLTGMPLATALSLGTLGGGALGSYLGGTQHGRSLMGNSSIPPQSAGAHIDPSLKAQSDVPASPPAGADKPALTPAQRAQNDQAALQRAPRPAPMNPGHDTPADPSMPPEGDIPADPTPVPPAPPATQQPAGKGQPGAPVVPNAATVNAPIVPGGATGGSHPPAQATPSVAPPHMQLGNQSLNIKPAIKPTPGFTSPGGAPNAFQPKKRL